MDEEEAYLVTRRCYLSHFHPFPGGVAKSTWEIQKTEEKGLLPQISSDWLELAALQNIVWKHHFRTFFGQFP